MLKAPDRNIRDIHFFQDPTYIDLLEGTHWQPSHQTFKAPNSENIIGSAVVMRRRLRLLPVDVMMVLFGPKMDFSDVGAVQIVLDQLKSQAKASGCIYVALQPYIAAAPMLHQQFIDAGYRPLPAHILYRHTGMLDLTPDESVLLAGFKESVRSSLRRAERDGVEVKCNPGPEAVGQLFELYRQSFERSGGGYQSQRYFENVWRILVPKREAIFALTYLHGKPVTAGLFGLIDGNMIYLSGGAVADKALMASQPNEMLHWQMIRLAKAWGCKAYDVGGVNPNPAPGSKSAGISGFKMKFCNRTESLLGFYRFASRPLLVSGLDRLLPLVTKISGRFSGAHETDYNLF